MGEPLEFLGAPEHPLLEQPEQDRLREEVENLRRQLEEERKRNTKGHQPHRPRRRTLLLVAAAIAAALVLAFFLGYIPQHQREQQLQQEAKARQELLPVLDYIVARRSPPNEQLLLPGNMQGLSDTPVLARADGFLEKWIHDMGDRVKKNELLAIIAAPDLDQQVRQARAQVLQSAASLKQAKASLDQGLANQALARVMRNRWDALLKRGAVAQQDYDQQDTNYKAQSAGVGALEQSVGAAEENASAAQANLDRFLALQQFEQVRAPFDGVLTLRNIDVGALITTGTTLLYREAQVDQLRTFIYVPETNAPMVQVNQPATLLVSAFPGRHFKGVVTRTADSLDPTSRTMLTEVDVPNPQGTLLPGMYAEVALTDTRPHPPILIPGDSVIVRANGLFVGVLTDRQAAPPAPLGPEKKAEKGSPEQELEQEEHLPTYVVHLVPVNVGRDYGTVIEILSGLNNGDRVIVNPNDAVQEGAKVKGQESTPTNETGAQPGEPRAGTQQLAPRPGAAPKPANPTQERKTRGPGK